MIGMGDITAGLVLLGISVLACCAGGTSAAKRGQMAFSSRGAVIR